MFSCCTQSLNKLLFLCKRICFDFSLVAQPRQIRIHGEVGKQRDAVLCGNDGRVNENTIYIMVAK